MKRVDGPEVIRQSLPDILFDESRFESGVPSTVCFPETGDELRRLITDAHTSGQPVTFIGAQTGTTGGAVPVDGCCAIAFSAMKRLHSIIMEQDSQPVLVCDPGVTLEAIERFLSAPRKWPETVAGSEKLTGGEWRYLPDPTEMTAQLGGTVATNASGARSFRFGPTREHIAFIDVVLADGHTVTLRTGAEESGWDRVITTDQGGTVSVPDLPYRSLSIKNAAGYYNVPGMSAADLFIGSEGTLGAIARIGIYLHRKPSIVAGLSFFPSTEAAFDFADFLRVLPEVAAIEFFDDGSLNLIDEYRDRLSDPLPPFPESARSAIFWEYIEEEEGYFENEMEKWEEVLVGCGSSFDETWSGFDEKEQSRLHHFRHALPEVINSIIAHHKKSCSSIRKVGTDSAYPASAFRSAFDETIGMIRHSGLPYAIFGHLGNYHLHINIIPATREELATALELYGGLMALAIGNGGTISAEHGIGKIKKRYLLEMYGDEGISGMRNVKAALDPKGILNPGNLF